ncbi:hypothetical protein FGO68_gene6910 [Halteria grandinella]|uniref:Uncharacterized protein n=1 Tax=Halteria grandinella TaxID=5974 RepID=A0A8J8T979_HALGN|nr:hypothetical protein FGO68_gene6910 [Halteria grandinella]
MEGKQLKEVLEQKPGQPLTDSMLISGNQLDLNNIKIINEAIYKKIESNPQLRTILAAPGQQILEYDFRDGIPHDMPPQYVNDMFHQGIEEENVTQTLITQIYNEDDMILQTQQKTRHISGDEEEADEPNQTFDKFLKI